MAATAHPLGRRLRKRLDKPMDYRTARGILMDEERQKLYDLAGLVPPEGCMVNIGVEYGASVVCLRQGNPSARLFAIDLDNSRLAENVSAVFVTGDSRKIVKTWSVPIHLLFVDGDHHWETVFSDLNGFGKLVVGGGWVALHDCYDPFRPDPAVLSPHTLWPEVNQVVEEWKRTAEGVWRESSPVRSMRVFQRSNSVWVEE